MTSRLLTLITIAATLSCARPRSQAGAAAFNGNLAAVKRLAASGQVNAPDGDGLSPLDWAARAGRVDAMRILLDAGADPDLRDQRNGWTPLLHAIHKNQPAAVDLLLARGARPDLPSASGEMTPLVMAAGYGYAGIVRSLLARGADATRPTSGGVTPLAAAVGGSNDVDRFTLGTCQTDTVKAILTARPDAPMGEKWDKRASVTVARLGGCKEVLQLIRR